MPKALHDKLAKQAKKEGYTGRRRESYIYGTLQKVEEELKKRKGKT